MLKSGYDVLLVGNRQLNSSELEKMGRECVSNYSQKKIISDNDCENADKLSVALFEDSPHIYVNPTENLMLGNYVKDGDTVATVYGSGDFALDAVFHGAKEVVGFDINKFQYPVGAFKTAALKVLDYDDYFSFFSDTMSSSYLDKSVYGKIKLADPKNKFYKFWDPMINQYDKDKKSLSGNPIVGMGEFSLFEIALTYSKIMGISYAKIPELIMGPQGVQTPGSYNENASSYEDTKEKLKSSNISFLKSSLLGFRRQLVLSKYLGSNFSGFDTIYLSNVPEYIEGDSFVNTVQKQLMPLLKDDGSVVYCCQGRDPKILSGGISSLNLRDNMSVDAVQEKNDVIAFDMLSKMYDVSIETAPTLSDFNGPSKHDTFVKVMKK